MGITERHGKSLHAIELFRELELDRNTPVYTQKFIQVIPILIIFIPFFRRSGRGTKPIGVNLKTRLHYYETLSGRMAIGLVLY